MRLAGCARDVRAALAAVDECGPVASSGGDSRYDNSPGDLSHSRPQSLTTVGESYTSSSFHIRSTMAAIMRAKLSFASVGFVPPSRSRA